MATAGMDELPDELVLHILSFVGDARTLLDAVPLVCKRWHTLHREPAAWCRVDLRCRAGDSEAARVLLHAPAARTLRLQAPQAVSPRGRRRFDSALRRTGLVPGRGLTVERSTLDWASAKAREDIAGLVRRGELRELDVTLPPRHVACGSLLRAVAGQRCLRRLVLRVGHCGTGYDGELAAGGPPLRELRVLAVRSGDDGDQEPDVPCRLVADLMAAAAASLRVLELDKSTDLDPESLGQLQELERLVLRVHLEAGWTSDAEAEASLEVQDVLAACARAGGALRSVRVSLHRGEHCGYTPELENECRASVDEFSDRRPDVEVDFFIDGFPLDADAYEYLDDASLEEAGDDDDDGW